VKTAILFNGKIVSADEYNPAIHGSRIYCIDKNCRATLIHVPRTETASAYFKTTGKSPDSRHNEKCSFFRPLTFEESVKKVQEFHEEIFGQQNSVIETVVRLNLNAIDPDYVPKAREQKEESNRETSRKEDIKIKNERTTPQTISSLKSIVKLFTSYEPDVLATILINVKGTKTPLSKIVVSHDIVHDLLWGDEIKNNSSYFVYGTIDKVLRREKVWYINFKPVNNVLFSLVVFNDYFKYFTYSDEQLIGKTVLAWGTLRRNMYQGKNTSEMVIKSNKYIEFIK